MTRALIACDVLEDELRQLLPATETFAHHERLPMGLHDRPDELRERLQEAIDRCEHAAAPDWIVLAYGRCGNGLLGVGARRARLVLPQVDDCVGLLLGGAARHRAVLAAAPGTYFYTPGWIRGRRVPGPEREQWLREIFAGRYEDEEYLQELVEADQACFAHCDRAAYLDVTGDATGEAYCRRCADHLGWRFERLAGDPGLLRDLIAGPWEDERFLVVAAGEVVPARWPAGPQAGGARP